MLNKKQKTALCLALILTAVILLSAVLTAVEAGHDCTGFDCPVCKLITDVSRLISGAAVMFVLILSAVWAHLVFHAVRAGSDFVNKTPVTEKIKLLN